MTVSGTVPAALGAAPLPPAPPALLDARSAWITHLPFGACLVAALRPRLVVELGVHVGVSYCNFVEAMAREGIAGRCLGVDTFVGDSHTEAYDGSVLAALRAHHDPRYGHFSTLRQATFDAAAEEIAPGSVDLLHIDGLHTYEAVRHDYETWAPKLSERGVVLFHDTEVRRRDFGVWRYWPEVSAGRAHFAFLHGFGLGVLAPGEVPAALRPLFDATGEAAEEIRALFQRLGRACLAALPAT
ncbi:class I SAM-dependent methyltransferase [Falsiroseomonas oryziterrae]|uniref:class I SAM-dependent methyltransferase n=1 Tax=Falsiroseomonas oryziterrae TaxID=2911368 RepID=UPI001F290D1C|nr:class I SAM-dependent methyltransferase [Roseomonas sp. NPKOSM-4]